MVFWKTFWMVSLVVAGSSFAFITLVVTVRGFADLLNMFSNLRKQGASDVSD
jgi:hypothetical protein